MAIDWDDNINRKEFREALQEAYPSDAALEMFVDEELNENLAVVAGGSNLQVTAYELVKWAKAKGRLDEVYSVFKKQNPKHPVIGKLERPTFVPRTFNLSPEDWEGLFDQFVADDIADLKRAFSQGFKEALGLAFRQAQPSHPALIAVSQIRELLESYDADPNGPVLAVRFVECAIAELKRSSEDQKRDLTALEQWRDRISKTYKVPVKASDPVPTGACHAYLLVVLEEVGADVNIYPELHITGIDRPIRFGAEPKTCAIHQVADWLSQWIKQAEETLEIRQCEEEEVTLELFLPCRYLEEDVAATWCVTDQRDREVQLGNHRRFLVRSSERIRDRKIQKTLQQKWERLERCVREGKGCSEFYLQLGCPEQPGALSAVLKDFNPTGLKLIASLPPDPSKRIDVLNEIIDSALPIALWFSELTEVEPDTLETEFNALLTQCCLTNFADLARRWRMRRRDSDLAKPLRLLCDRPDRLPDPPDPNREEDLLVAF